jgi:major membrane immunogen (membrane-anchored lipoprotein)
MKNPWLTLASVFMVATLLLTVGCGESEPEPEVKALGDISPEEAPLASTDKKKKKSYSLIQGSFAAAEKSLDDGDYEKAAQVLLKIQMSGALKNSKDSWKYSSLMSEVQSVLASAAADGDKKAEKTIEMLRRSRGPM